ncbi:MAG: class I SAM-dependent methyltransferase [Gammaproteobacteria bacterium]|nr:class I SAM-dependent methyltransferase [Gammaproteobacteria bacterium]
MTASDHGNCVPALRYRWLTPYYDAVVGISTRERTFKTALIAQAGLESGHQVLDLACGAGTLSIWAKEALPDMIVLGVDGDPDVLSIARRKAVRANSVVEFETAMSYDLPYPNAHFDRVLSSLFFHHLSFDDKVRTAKEVYRVLKPGGQLHVADWGRAENLAMRGLFVFVQILDGFANTQDNVKGKLAGVFDEAGLSSVTEHQTFRTMFGILALYSADKPELPTESLNN